MKIVHRLITSIVVLAAVSVVSAAVPAIAPAGVEHAAELVSVDALPRLTAPGLDRDTLAAEDAERERLGLPYRFAVPSPVAVTPGTHGTWEETGEGTALWRLRVVSPDAHSLNLGFTRFVMPEGGRLYVYAPDMSTWLRPYTTADNASHGELWTPVLLGGDLVVEVDLPAGARDELQLHLGSVNVGYRGFGAPKEDPGTDSGSCNVDVVCPLGDGWRSEIPSVARITIGGFTLCTGFMVNNAAQDQTPYFMTARHCGATSGNAASVVAYWNYETSICAGTPDGSLADNQSGSFWRSAYTPSDFTLLELDQDPDPAWGVTFAGWDNSGNDALEAVAIHHPQGDEKRISFEYQPTTTTSYLGTGVPGDGTHVRVADWDEGTTEGGSSGSPLFDESHRVIGQLHGGYAACGNDLADWYGKLSVSWTGGGTSTSRLSDWLDPAGTGATAIDTLDPNAGCTVNADCDDGLFCNGAETCDAGGSCVAGSDPCPGQGCDEAGDVCFPLTCDNDGVCESGEDCDGCAGDCISGSAATCGNDICEAGAGEDCLSCPGDCNGLQSGKPSNRYCCGDGDGSNPVGCGDSRCSANGNTCSGGAGAPYCCGDGVCEGAETVANCAVDCDGGTCAAVGESCVEDIDCCTNKCRGSSGNKTCK